MDNNEAREIDYADAATGPDPLDIDHCDACGFDLETHHPTCLRAYGLGRYGNPNRPTGPHYCAMCALDHCLWYDDNGALVYLSDGHDPAPITLETHESRQARALIDSLTDEQRRDALMYLSGYSLEHLQWAVKLVTR